MHQRIVDIFPWSALFSESLPGSIIRMVKGIEVIRGLRKVAGIELPVLESVKFEINPYSRFSTPPWVDKGVDFVKIILEMREKARILLDQQDILKKELRKITQRVNLFEKVLIPHCREIIRVIHIQLGEEQTASVVQAKIAREKIAGSPK